MSEQVVASTDGLPLERLPFLLEPDPRRVLLRPFLPSLVVKPTATASNMERLERLMARLAAVPSATCGLELERLRHRFGVRHRTLERLAHQRWQDVLAPLQPQHPLSEEQQLLLEAAAAGA